MNIKLSPEEVSKVIKAYKVHNYTQTAIAKAFGVSQARIHQILKENGVIGTAKRQLDITNI